jgi:hypothetical protein
MKLSFFKYSHDCLTCYSTDNYFKLVTNEITLISSNNHGQPAIIIIIIIIKYDSVRSTYCDNEVLHLNISYPI